MKLSLLAVSAVSVLMTFSLPTQAQSQGQGGKIKDKVYNISSQDAEMEEAIAKARATLDDFLKLQAKPPKGADGFKIKVKFSGGGNDEHIWVTPFQVTPKGFTGTLAGSRAMSRTWRTGRACSSPGPMCRTGVMCKTANKRAATPCASCSG